MATYPTDAKTTITAFPVTSTIIYTNTGTETVFNLSAAVAHRGEVVAFLDGILQATDTYAVSNSGATVTFNDAPNSSNLTLQTVSVPEKLKQTRSSFQSRSQEYSNSAVVVNGNTYAINGESITFALPAGSSVSNTDEFQVFLSGLYQNPTAYVFPSTTLGNQGIDISDNAATKLLLNFTNNLTDESDTAHTITAVPGGGAFGSSDGIVKRIFNGTQLLKADSHSEFDLNSKSFTYDTMFRPDAGITMASNQTLLARHEDSNNHFSVHLVGANSNVGVQFTHGGDTTEIYGGNANGGIDYHVAVSYDSHTNNLRLYVNNVKVAHTGMAAMAGIQGDLVLGANSVESSNGEYFNGSVDFVRIADGVRYRSDEISAVTNTHHELITVQTGSPLGATYQEDTLSIRVFDSSVETLDRFTSMADRKPDKGITSSRTFDVTTFASQAGYEKRRLKSRRSKRSYELQYSSITGVEKTAIENFYNARSGEFESFSFDLSHINESGIITTRFAGPLQIEQSYSVGSRLIDNFYTVSFSLQEVFD